MLSMRFQVPAPPVPAYVKTWSPTRLVHEPDCTTKVTLPPVTEAWIPQGPFPPPGKAANADQTIGFALMSFVT